MHKQVLAAVEAWLRDSERGRAAGGGRPSGGGQVQNDSITTSADSFIVELLWQAKK